MENLTVIIPTYNRPDILDQTIAWLNDNLDYAGSFEILVGNDGNLNKATFGIHPSNVRVLNGPKRGLGANLNMLIKAAETDLVLQMDDDHHLVKPLDINQFSQDLIERKNGIGWVRLFLGTEEDLNNDDPFYKFHALMLERYWYPTPDKGEFYIASNRPHLKLKEFHSEWYGYYQEDESLGNTETHFCGQYISRHKELDGVSNRPWVVIPVAAPSFDTWKHVGESFQHTEHDHG